MKLYFGPASCSLAPHIVLHELNLPFEAERVDMRQKTVSTGDFNQINPKGYVPVLMLDNKEILTEAAVILQYLADQKPEARLIPASGTMERYRAQEWLNYIATEVHKGFSPLWKKDNADSVKEAALESLKKKLDFLSQQLQKTPYLLGSNFSVADAYLFTVLNWTNYLKIDLAPWPALQKFLATVSVRPSVQATLKAEGLLRAA